MSNEQLNDKSLESTRLEGVSFVENSRVCRRRARIRMQCAMSNEQLNDKSLESTRLEGVSFVENSRVCRRRARIRMQCAMSNEQLAMSNEQ